MNLRRRPLRHSGADLALRSSTWKLAASWRVRASSSGESISTWPTAFMRSGIGCVLPSISTSRRNTRTWSAVSRPMFVTAKLRPAGDRQHRLAVVPAQLDRRLPLGLENLLRLVRVGHVVERAGAARAEAADLRSRRRRPDVGIESAAHGARSARRRSSRPARRRSPPSRCRSISCTRPPRTSALRDGDTITTG